MKGFIVGLLLGLMATAAAEVTITRWQDLQPYIAQLANKVNAQDAKIAALQTEVATLKTRLTAAEAQVAKSKTDVGNLIVSHNVSVYYWLVQACAYNAKVNGWKGILTGLEPQPLGGLACPPAGSRFYTPYFHPDVSAVPIPPAQ